MLHDRNRDRNRSRDSSVEAAIFAEIHLHLSEFMITAPTPFNQETPAGWWHLLPPGERYPKLSGDGACSYAIVGAGWTGLAAARRLAERAPNARIVVIDAGQIGYGAAGRNSGFLWDLPFLFPADGYHEREAEGRQEIALYRGVIEEMRRFVRAHRVECGWSEIGQYHVAAGIHGRRELSSVETGLSNLQEPFRVLDQAATQAELGTDFYNGAIHTPGTVQINPLALLRALATNMPKNVEIFECSPVTRVDGGPLPRITTETGHISADQILLTTNAYLSAFRGVKAALLPAMTFAGLTGPTDGLSASAAAGSWGAVPAALFGSSLRRLSDGRLLVRNTYAYAGNFRASARLSEQARKRLELSLRRRFPHHSDLHFDHIWGGLVSFFRGAKGCFSEVAPRVHAAATAGMPLSTLYGQVLADVVIGGAASNELDFVRRHSMPARLPPPPLRSVAVRSAAAIRQFRERAEI